MVQKKTLKLDLYKLAYLAPNNVKINHCLVRNGYPTEIFIDSLEDNEIAEIIALFKLFGEKKGQLFNETKFKKLENNAYEAIFEFKSYQIRLAGFWRRNYNFNLIYGFKKKQQKWPQVDLSAMRKNLEEHISEEKRREVK